MAFTRSARSIRFLEHGPRRVLGAAARCDLLHDPFAVAELGSVGGRLQQQPVGTVSAGGHRFAAELAAAVGPAREPLVVFGNNLRAAGQGLGERFAVDGSHGSLCLSSRYFDVEELGQFVCCIESDGLFARCELHE